MIGGSGMLLCDVRRIRACAARVLVASRLRGCGARRLLQCCHERLYRLACVARYVGLCWVHRRWVLSLPPNPSVDDLFCLHESLLLSWRQSSLVHVFSFLFLFCLVLHPSIAKADVQWVTKDSADYGYVGYVYPYPYSDEGRWAAVADFLGFNWDSFSKQQRDAIKSTPELDDIIHNDDYVRNLAYGVVADKDLPDFIKGVDDWIVQLFGGDTIYAVAMSSADYDFAQGEFEYWAYPRGTDSPSDGVLVPAPSQFGSLFSTGN